MKMSPYLILLGRLLGTIVLAQTPEPASRQLWNEDFLQKRPVSKGGVPKRRIEYRPVSPAAQPPGPKAADGATDITLGVTLWRLRSSGQNGAGGARLLLLEPSGPANQEMIPERVEADTILAEGEKVRLAVEAPLAGYLYVIDREQYADGTFSEPYLIYPNWQTRPGDNAVAPGRLIEIPDQRDEPNCFTVRSSRPGQTAEAIFLLITPEPISDLKAGRKPLLLDRDRFAEWNGKWGVSVERFELQGGAGTPWSEKEKAAGNSRAILTQDDAMPQTLCHVRQKPGTAMLIKLPLRLK